MKVVFRADASLQIGTGHVMRCLTLASALRDRGADCRFICREHPGSLLELIRKLGFEADPLPLEHADERQPRKADEQNPAHAAWLGADWRTDAEQTKSKLGEKPVDWLIVDHYALDARWESALRFHCRKIMVIDDLADRSHDSDLLLDQNLVADMSRRYDGKVPAHCGLMLGPNYALLQPQYAELHPRVPPREGPVQRVLAYFGGADADNLTGMAICAFLYLGRTDVRLDVVVNAVNPHTDSVRRQVQDYGNITVHSGLPTLAPLMVQADLAIGAGGATSWERCCLGLPSLVVTLAENQRPIAAELERRGLIRWLGHKQEVSEATLTRVLGEILDKGVDSNWSARCQREVDGCGAERVRGILMLDADTPLKARLARLDDEALLYGWANDPQVRENAFTPDVIDWTTHRTWFRKRLRAPESCRIYVVETDDGLPVGQVRFERSDEAWEIDYALDARARDRNLGKKLLQTAMLALRVSTKGVLLLGRVKASNGASRKVFQAIGFETDNGVGDTIVYRYLL